MSEKEVGKINFFIKAGVIFLAVIFSAVSSFGQKADNNKIIFIVTPEWDGQTNKDGTGLFFDIVRSVYEPEGIKMKFEIVPWKRAELMVTSKKADALLDSYMENIVGKEMLVPVHPLVVEATAAVFRKDKISIWKGPPSLSNMRAIWLRGYDFHKSPHLKGVIFKKWDEIDEYDTAWHLLEKNRSDVYLDARIDMQRYINKYKIDMSHYRLETVGEDKGYIVFAKTGKSEKLIKIYDKNIKKLFKSGELERLFKKWDYPFPTDVWE